MSTEPQTIQLKVLRVASGTVLGRSDALQVIDPCKFSNARGDLKAVNNHEDIRKTALESGRNFLQVFGTK
jgi:hypothetical protein